MGLLVHPDMVLLDLVGPQTVFSLLMAKVHLVWKDRTPVTTDVGVAITPTTTFAGGARRALRPRRLEGLGRLHGRR